MNTDAFANIRPTKLVFYLRCMKKFGFSANHVLAGTNLNKEKLDDRYFLVETSDYIRVVSNMMRLTKSEDLAFRLGNELVPGDLGILGHTVSTCTNTKEATNVWLKYNWLFFGNLFSASESHNEGVLSFEYSPRVKLAPELVQYFIEEKISIETTLFREFNHARLPSKHYSVTYPAPVHSKLYEDQLGIKVTFNAEKNCFSLHSNNEYFSDPLPGADRETLEVCLAHLEHITNTAQTHTTLSAKTRYLIKQQLPKIISSEDMAKEFGYSTRTFNRHLKSEGTNYQKIIARIRENTAKNYLASTMLTTDEIAALLGFNDPSSLSRAFKTWTGITISGYKKLSKLTI